LFSGVLEKNVFCLDRLTFLTISVTY